MEKELTFVLFACCVPVKGAIRSTICDLQRNTYHFIPNILYEILTKFHHKTPSEIKRYYGIENEGIIDEYFDFLLKNELGFYAHEPERFPGLDLTWQNPKKITNAIVDVSADSDHNFELISRQLDSVGCGALELRFFAPVSEIALIQILDEFRTSRLRSINLVIHYHPNYTHTEFFEHYVQQNHRIINILVHNAPDYQSIRLLSVPTLVTYVQKNVSDENCCGNINPNYFSINISTFSEAQNFNSCLNQKISIDRQGNIKNCPAMARSFGQLDNTTLADVAKHPEFTSVWAAGKDKISICKDCEFRYICTDCRAFLDDTHDFAKPKKCNYDPYSAKWQAHTIDCQVLE